MITGGDFDADSWLPMIVACEWWHRHHQECHQSLTNRQLITKLSYDDMIGKLLRC